MTRGQLALAAGLALAAAALSAPGCTRAGLESIPEIPRVVDDKLEISGSLCTLPPQSLTYPVRVLFVVDASDSMEVNDPIDPLTGEAGRQRAVREVWETLLAEETDDVRFGILRFSGYTQSKTGTDDDGDGFPDTWFTAEPEKLEVATAALALTDGTTDYLNALSEAHFQVRNEMERAELESLPLSKFVVIFLSDGLPDLEGVQAGGGGQTDQILGAVQSFRDLADLFQVQDLTFHTAYLSSGQGPAVDQPAQELLQGMAEVGGGTYRSFPNGEEINFLSVDFGVVHRVFSLQTLAAINLNSVVAANQTDAFAALIPPGLGLSAASIDLDPDDPCGVPLTDSDADGLCDMGEIVFGSDPLVADTDNDGLGDHVEWALNLLAGEGGKVFDPLTPDSGCFIADPVEEDPDGTVCADADEDGWCDCPDEDGDGACDVFVDGDGDGLRDCEELFLGTAHNGVDTDADGLPDPLEVRLGTSAVESDGAGDLDWDDTLNGVEVLTHTDPLCDDLDLRSKLAYRYELYSLGLKAGTPSEVVEGLGADIDADVIGDTDAHSPADADAGPVPDDEPDAEVNAELDGDAGPTEPEAQVVPDIGATSCYDFTVGNITLMPTLANTEAERPGNGWNRILIFAGEAGFDSSETFARFRVACVDALYRWRGDYKMPPSGRLSLVEEDFVPVAEFDPDLHCVAP